MELPLSNKFTKVYCLIQLGNKHYKDIDLEEIENYNAQLQTTLSNYETISEERNENIN